MRRPKRSVQLKPSPDGISPSPEAREVLAYVVHVTETAVRAHCQSSPPQRRDDGCGPLFASRLLHILRTRQNLPHPEDPEAYYLTAHYSAGLDVQVMYRGLATNLDNTTTQECRRIAALEKLRFDRRKLQANIQRKNPYENLAEYAKVAILRPMPWVPDGSDPEHKRATEASTQPAPETRSIPDTLSKASKSNPTPIPAGPGPSTVREPDDKRTLQEIYRISANDLKRYVKAFSSDHLPKEFCVDSDGDPITLAGPDIPEPISIHHPSYSVHPASLPKFVGSEETRILNVVDPSTSAWGFDHIYGQETQDLKSDFAWQCNLWQDTGVDVADRLIVEVKAPWVMRTKDFEEFVAIGKLRKASEITAEVRANNNGVIPTDKYGDPEPPTFKKVENVWAQIYDYCTRQNHHFFVLTSYENWAFGVFSLRYEIAYVSDVIAYDNTGPTVLECLLYWVQSAMLVPGLFEVPRVSTAMASAHKTDTVHAIDHAWIRNPRAVAILGSVL
ncbi:hypothetical protein FRC05_006743 [Tulasnella sp. 425]|nr:hypothetical protein FRC05_006743 [Tulasnella sp. 425]